MTDPTRNHMATTLAAFEAFTGVRLTPEQGHLFLACSHIAWGVGPEGEPRDYDEAKFQLNNAGIAADAADLAPRPKLPLVSIVPGATGEEVEAIRAAIKAGNLDGMRHQWTPLRPGMSCPVPARPALALLADGRVTAFGMPVQPFAATVAWRYMEPGE